MRQVYLSVVATSRNDNHGDNLLFRMQHFINGFVQQCIRHQLNAELILVEWNPPPDKPSLAQALVFPTEKGPCQIRIITVPPEIHQQLKHANKLPLFQMIAKNVGIRRARGQYVLATNIDILFSDKLIQHIANQLQTERLYRADRVDVSLNLSPNTPFDDLLAHCQKNVLRINKRYGSYTKINNQWKKIKPKKQRSLAEKLIKFINYPLEMKIKAIQIRLTSLFEKPLHTNACGDFTLLSYNDWLNLRGYPEWEMYSWHIDSVLLHQAKKSGIKEINLPKKMPVYHIDHHVGSGYTAENPIVLFKRLDLVNVPYMTDDTLSTIIKHMKKRQKQGRSIVYNEITWGFADLPFKETLVYPC